MDREKLRAQFINDCGYEDAEMQSLPVDASARSYHRLTRGGKRVMLMDAPPATEDVAAFRDIGRHLASLGLSTPVIYEMDEINGFMLLEDFGDDTYSRLMNAGAAAEPLYRRAVDVLAHIHNHPKSTDITVPPYDEAFMLMEVGLFTGWYWPEEKGEACPETIAEAYLQAWREVFAEKPMLAPELVIRDFHVDNLMLLPGRDGLAACGILDFQSALMGQASYDLMSLLEDARRDVPEDLRASMVAHYFSQRGDLDRDAFLHWYDVLGAQRHAKILGGFMRTWRRDGKDGYLQFMPRVRRLLAPKLARPALAPVRDWFAAHMPEILASD